MQKPVINRKRITEASYDMSDTILNGHIFSKSGYVVKDLNDHKFFYAPYYIRNDEIGYYLVAAVTDDPCRIAFELGELS